MAASPRPPDTPRFGGRKIGDTPFTRFGGVRATVLAGSRATSHRLAATTEQCARQADMSGRGHALVEATARKPWSGGAFGAGVPRAFSGALPVSHPAQGISRASPGAVFGRLQSSQAPHGWMMMPQQAHPSLAWAQHNQPAHFTGPVMVAAAPAQSWPMGAAAAAGAAHPAAAMSHVPYWAPWNPMVGGSPPQGAAWPASSAPMWGAAPVGVSPGGFAAAQRPPVTHIHSPRQGTWSSQPQQVVPAVWMVTSPAGEVRWGAGG